MLLKVFSAFPGRAQPKISTWFSKSQSKFDLKGYKKKRLGLNMNIFLCLRA